MSAPSVADLVATDLDRTLIFSATSAGAGFVAPGPTAPGSTTPGSTAPDDGPAARDATDPPVCVEIYDGAPLSYVTAAAHRDLARAMATGRVVPVTTRTVEQYRRVRLPGPTPPHAICLNGGALLVDGVEDAAYGAEMARMIGAAASAFDVVAAEVLRVSTLATGELAPWVKSVRDASGMFCYVVCHRAQWPPEWLDELRATADRHQWQVSAQGRKVYVVPGPLTKHAALAHLVERTGATTVHAAGDSLLDEQMILDSHHGMVPRSSELHNARGVLPEHVSLTREAGIAAGEEVAAWIRRALCAQPAPGRGDADSVTS